MMKPIMRVMIAAATAAAATGIDLPSSFAFGNAPWCAVISLGTGSVYWDCQYRSVEECAPNVVAGNRGFCQMNPYGAGPPYTSTPAARKHRKKHYAQDR